MDKFDDNRDNDTKLLDQILLDLEGVNKDCSKEENVKRQEEKERERDFFGRENSTL